LQARGRTNTRPQEYALPCVRRSQHLNRYRQRVPDACRPRLKYFTDCQRHSPLPSSPYMCCSTAAVSFSTASCSLNCSTACCRTGISGLSMLWMLRLLLHKAGLSKSVLPQQDALDAFLVKLCGHDTPCSSLRLFSGKVRKWSDVAIRLVPVQFSCASPLTAKLQAGDVEACTLFAGLLCDVPEQYIADFQCSSSQMCSHTNKLSSPARKSQKP
jgi:hypothetical protein